MRQTDTCDIVMAESQHIFITFKNMKNLADSEPAADIVHQTEDISFVRVQPGDFFSNLSRIFSDGAAVLLPGAGCQACSCL